MPEDIYQTEELKYEDLRDKDAKIIEEDPVKFQFYENLRAKAKNWSKEKTGSIGGKLGEYLFLLPDFFILICRIAIDKRVPAKQKLMIGGIIGYVIMPIDIIPDFIPVVGYLDDLVLVVMGLNMLLNDVDERVLRDNWSGEGDVLEWLKKIAATADQFLNQKVLNKIKQWFNSFK